MSVLIEKIEERSVHLDATPDVGSAVLAALAYADLFDYPLTLEQVVLFQVGTSYSHDEVAQSLLELSRDGEAVTSSGDYYSLRGRELVFKIRQERQQHSALIWQRARLRARWVAMTPFVRMVAVTGALSMDNIVGKPDIDLLILAQPGRVWICRRLLILQVRLARLFGDDLCPNYILSANNLELDQRDFFTAHELAQMVPLYGRALCRQMIAQNRWAMRYLPAAFPANTAPLAPNRSKGAKRFFERLLGTRPFDALDRWELKRLRRKLAPLIGKAAEVVCSPDQCKGHTGLHRASVLTRYQERLQQLGIYDPFDRLLS